MRSEAERFLGGEIRGGDGAGEMMWFFQWDLSPESERLGRPAERPTCVVAAMPLHVISANREVRTGGALLVCPTALLICV